MATVVVRETDSVRMERIRHTEFGTESYRGTHKVTGTTFTVPRFEAETILKTLTALIAEPFN